MLSSLADRDGGGIGIGDAVRCSFGGEPGGWLIQRVAVLSAPQRAAVLAFLDHRCARRGREVSAFDRLRLRAAQRALA